MILNTSQPRPDQRATAKLALALLLVVAQLWIARPSKAFIIETIATVIGGGLAADAVLGNLVNNITGAVKQTVETVRENITAIVDQLEDKFQNNRDVTLDMLDAQTSKLLRDAYDYFTRVEQQALNDVTLLTNGTINRISNELNDLLSKGTNEIRGLSQNLSAELQDLILYTRDQTVFVLNRATENLLTVVALIALVIVGAIAFVMLVSRKWPSGLQGGLAALLGVALILLLFAFLFVPQVRTLALGLGLGGARQFDNVVPKPLIDTVTPKTVVLGVDRVLTLRGRGLQPPTGKALKVRIGGQDVAATGTGTEIGINLTGFAIASGPYVVEALHDADVVAAANLYVDNVPNPAITAFTLTPAAPGIGEAVSANVTIQNRGGPARNLTVTVTTGEGADKRDQVISALEAGGNRTVTLGPWSYSTSGPRTLRATAALDGAVGGVIADRQREMRINVALPVCQELPLFQTNEFTTIKLIPPLVDPDAELSSHGPRMNLDVTVFHTDRNVFFSASLRIREWENGRPSSDGSEAFGRFNSQPIALPRTIPAGFAIVSVQVPDGQLSVSFDRIMTARTETRPGRGPLKTFVLHGDRDGDELGTHSGATLTFNPVTVRVRQVANCR